ncbi:MAG: hypothetical protein ACRDIV_18915 [Ktedonobacteraceae bacterium]
MPEPRSSLLQVVIFTALPVEYLAVRSHLSDLRQEVHSEGTIYECGVFPVRDRGWSVAIVKTFAGNVSAAIEVERALQYLKPDLALFVGVAGGIKEDVQLGDVVVAKKIYGYESGKVADTFQTRPEVGNSSYRLIKRAEVERNSTAWLRWLGGPIPDPSPRVFVAPIAAGEKVLASTKSEIRERLHANYNDALAIEMEGYGFLKAVYANQHVQALVIRGISDLIDNKSEADAANFQEVAARHAAAFAFEMLAKLDEDKTFRASHERTNTVKKTRRSGRATPGTSKYHVQNMGDVQQSVVGDNPQVTIHYGNDQPKK